MLGRKTYTSDEIDHERASITAQLDTYDAVRAAAGAGTPVADASDAFDPWFFNHLVLALDRPFVHRVRPVSGKDGNPLNEVELLVDSLVQHDGVLTANKVIKLVPADSVTMIEFDTPIQLDRDQFGRLADAFFGELESRFLEA